MYEFGGCSVWNAQNHDVGVVEEQIRKRKRQW